MIERLEKSNWQDVVPLLVEHTPENYFNLLGVLSSKPVYRDIYVQRNERETIDSYVFHRLSGTVKFFALGDYDVQELADFLKQLDFRKFIGPATSTIKLEEKGVIENGRTVTYLCELTDSSKVEVEDCTGIRELRLEDLPQVVELYMEVFKSYASEQVMEEKLRTGRGRCYGLWEGNRLLSVVQTDFEQDDSALIVGVATRINKQKMGYGTKLLSHAIKILQVEGKKLFLEYENPEAGGLYKKLGFTEFETIIEYSKSD
ncbi:MAG: GNAT family N-acetyltransferase [Bacillota bacterium]